MTSSKAIRAAETSLKQCGGRGCLFKAAPRFDPEVHPNIGEQPGVRVLADPSAGRFRSGACVGECSGEQSDDDSRGMTSLYMSQAYDPAAAASSQPFSQPCASVGGGSCPSQTLAQLAREVGHTPTTAVSSFYLVGFAQAAKADAARVGLAIDYMRHAEDDVEPPRAGLPRLTTIEVTPEEVGPHAVKLDEASRAKLAAAGADPEQVERELHGMRRGDRKLLAEVVYGAKGGVPRIELEEQLRWYSIAPTEEEEERIARGETVTFVIGTDDPNP